MTKAFFQNHEIVKLKKSRKNRRAAAPGSRTTPKGAPHKN
jgi:hypothetical protein